MLSFSNSVLKLNWAPGSVASTSFSTDIVESASGFEYTNQKWKESKKRWELGNKNVTRSELDYITSFFQNRRGQAQPFLIKDETDYIAINQEIGIGDGIKTEFQLKKNYTIDTDTVSKTIKKPVGGTITVYVNGTPTVVTVDLSTGIVTFSAPPAAAAVITADFEYYYPARFQTDEIRTSIIIEDGDASIYNVQSIPVVEFYVQ